MYVYIYICVYIYVVKYSYMPYIMWCALYVYPHVIHVYIYIKLHIIDSSFFFPKVFVLTRFRPHR